MTAAPTAAHRDAVAFALRRGQSGEVRFDAGSQALYATDASSYRHVPWGVVTPRTIDDLVATVAICVANDAPILLRGAGTSQAGQACNEAVVVDTSRHLRGVGEVDVEARRITTEPGAVLADVQRAAASHGLTFGPDPSTATRCTIGGMLGNNACGTHSLRTGRTSDNVAALTVLLTDGARLELVSPTAGPSPDHPRLARLTEDLAAIATARSAEISRRFPRDIPRLVSGIDLRRLLDVDGPDLARLLVGTEGTCSVVLGATLDLVVRPAARALLVLGVADMFAAADLAADLRATTAIGVEAFDAAVVRNAPRARALLPEGGAWILVETGGTQGAEAEAAAEQIARTFADAVVDVRVVTAPDAQAALWRARADGLGAITFAGEGPPRTQGFEDAAVPPAELGVWLRALDEIRTEHDLGWSVYGHLGDGCLHTKIGFDLVTDAGIASYRSFVEAAADLTVAHGGSMSGEHGDGQARGELLERMFGREIIDAFAEVRRAFDGTGLLNPHRLDAAPPLDADLRMRGFAPLPMSLGAEAARCVGMGVCVRDEPSGTMCPSHQATRDEQHSTRGRARLLFELARGDHEVGDGSALDTATAEALSLCLSCKACAVECPTGVDVARMKSTYLDQRHRTVRRPLSHQVFGRAHVWLRMASRMPRLAGSLAGRRSIRRLATGLGITPDRPLPLPAGERLQDWWAARLPAPSDGARRVVLVADTFTDVVAPQVGRDAVAVLEASGHRVEIVAPACCGRPLHDVGMLDAARRAARDITSDLLPHARARTPILVLEPSCRSVLRDDGPALLHGDADASAVAAMTTTLAELLLVALDDGRWSPPSLDLPAIAVQPHCHARAAAEDDAELALLRRLGAEVDDLDAGCCGLAGAFGFTAGEPAAVSLAIAEHRMAPELDARPDHAIVADGVSCRMQIDHVRGRAATHLATLLAAALRPDQQVS